MTLARTRAYPNVLAYVRDTPWAITHDAFARVSEVVKLHLSGWRPSEQETVELEAMASRRPGYQSAGAVAVIPLQGLLVPRASLFSAMSGGTSMEDFRGALQAAANDPSVSEIILDVDSPGGVVDMIPETAQAIRDTAARKPVTAAVNTSAGSAAYWLASQCSEVCVTPSGSVGSIGCFAAHDDMSGMLSQKGVKTSLIVSDVSPHKTEGNPYEPLTPEARAAIQQRVNDVGEAFVNEVALGRGVDSQTVADTFGGGRMVAAHAAVRLGMADRVESMQQTLSRVLTRNSGTGALGPAALELPPKATEPVAEQFPLVPEHDALIASPAFRAAYSTGR